MEILKTKKNYVTVIYIFGESVLSIM